MEQDGAERHNLPGLLKPRIAGLPGLEALVGRAATRTNRAHNQSLPDCLPSLPPSARPIESLKALVYMDPYAFLAGLALASDGSDG